MLKRIGRSLLWAFVFWCGAFFVTGALQFTLNFRAALAREGPAIQVIEIMGPTQHFIADMSFLVGLLLALLGFLPGTRRARKKLPQG